MCPLAAVVTSTAFQPLLSHVVDPAISKPGEDFKAVHSMWLLGRANGFSKALNLESMWGWELAERY